MPWRRLSASGSTARCGSTRGAGRLRDGRLELPAGPDRRRGPRAIEAGADAVAVCAEFRHPRRPEAADKPGRPVHQHRRGHRLLRTDKVLSIDPAQRTCVVEPGIVLDELNRQLADHQLRFGPKPSTHSHCSLGGMIGNNSCGGSAQAYGKTVDNVRRLEILTY